MTDRIPLMVPDITEDDIAAVVEVLRSGNLIQGKNVSAFEHEVADYLGTNHVVAVSNGTSSLHVALLALGLGPGDEVIVPAFSFIATANVVELVGATCRFVDIDLATFNIDVARIEDAITANTRAIMPVHEFGLACDMSAIMDLARRHDLLVIEDAACALGATENGRFVGTFGNVGSFSLHPRKAVTSGEGGLLVTDDDELARKFRRLRNHGIENVNGGQQLPSPGLNYRLTDFQAAMVRGQFRRLEDKIHRRAVLAQNYNSALCNNPSVSLPSTTAERRHTWQTYHVILPTRSARDLAIEKLKEKGIGSNYGAQCIPSAEYYRNKYLFDGSDQFPNARIAYERGLALPMFDALLPESVAEVSSELQKILED